jgi:hypothetical protein
MIVRLRSRDGLERIEVDNSGTVGGLKLAIKKQLDIPIENITLSTKQQLLTSKEPAGFTDMADNAARLSAVGVSHGSMVFMFYDFERSVEPVGKVDTRCACTAASPPCCRCLCCLCTACCCCCCCWGCR